MVFVRFPINGCIQCVIYPVNPVQVYPIRSRKEYGWVKTGISVLIRMHRVIFSGELCFLNGQPVFHFIRIHKVLNRHECAPSTVIDIAEFYDSLILIIIHCLFERQDDFAIVLIGFLEKRCIRSIALLIEVVDTQLNDIISCFYGLFVFLIIQASTHFQCQSCSSRYSSAFLRNNIQLSLLWNLIRFFYDEFRDLWFRGCRQFGFFQILNHLSNKRDISVGSCHHIVSPGTQETYFILQLGEPLGVTKFNVRVFHLREEIVAAGYGGVIKPTNARCLMSSISAGIDREVFIDGTVSIVTKDIVINRVVLVHISIITADCQHFYILFCFRKGCGRQSIVRESVQRASTECHARQ